MKDDDLRMTIPGGLDQDAAWQVVEDAPESRISCESRLCVDDLIEIKDGVAPDPSIEMTHDSEDGRYQAAVTDATQRLVIRID